jgi:AAA family ATP:ADP antiporter
MTSLAARVRPGERREVAAALATAFLVMMAHAQLETARDTLFLTNLAPSKLPCVYLVIAVLSVLFGPILGRSGNDRLNRRTLVAMQIVAAFGTAVFILPWPSREKMFYALYIWGGLAAAVILTRFWLILGNRLTVSQAKRLFPLIASGTVGGSLVGFAVGGLLAAKFGAHASPAAPSRSAAPRRRRGGGTCR